jgi:hypothetical protein
MIKLSGEEFQEFNDWAFGKKWKFSENTLNLMKKWNDLHGHLFTLNPMGCIEDDAVKMIEIWRREKYRD